MGFTIIINDINVIAYGFNKNNCNMYILVVTIGSTIIASYVAIKEYKQYRKYKKLKKL